MSLSIGPIVNTHNPRGDSVRLATLTDTNGMVVASFPVTPMSPTRVDQFTPQKAADTAFSHWTGH